MKNPQKSFKPRFFDNPCAALDRVEKIYSTGVGYLRDSFDSFAGGKVPKSRFRAFYPYVRFKAVSAARKDRRLSFGFVAGKGVYETTLTRPDIFARYYKKQFELLLKNHGGKIETGVSDTPIPIHFALHDDFYLEGGLDSTQLEEFNRFFDHPDLDMLDDTIPNATYVVPNGEAKPLALFTAPRVDISLLRLKHYTLTKALHFQNFVIFTNYQFYIDEFVRIGREIMTRSDDESVRKRRAEYTAFVEPGEKITCNRNIDDAKKRGEDRAGFNIGHDPQMPAYHLKRENGMGITIVNIGVGPSNAKTITDHIAVLRPHAWLMLGHCAGLRNSQSLGDYVLAHGYMREDNVLYHDLHPAIPIPPLAEVQMSLERAVSEVTGYEGYDLKKVMRTGTVATVDDRNWEFRPSHRQNKRLSQSRAIALDMESGTIAANGFRFRVPYGTLLCVSDKPLHGQLKLPGMADDFYRKRVEQHLKIGFRAMEILSDIGPEKLHSRKLRSFNEVAFQ